MRQQNKNDGGKVVRTQVARDLSQADAAMRRTGEVLPVLIQFGDQGLLSDAVVSRCRGFIDSLARQLTPSSKDFPHSNDATAMTARHLLSVDVLRTHCHALAIEWQLTERLHANQQIEPVLSPVLQTHVASSDASTAELAIATIAAQSRFVQQQSRMETSIKDLSGETMNAIFKALMETNSGAQILPLEKVMHEFDESLGRLNLLERVSSRMDGNDNKVTQCGVALLLTSLAKATAQHRDLLTLSCAQAASPRLTLTLLAAGRPMEQTLETVSLVSGKSPDPDTFASLSAEDAQGALSMSDPAQKARR